MPRKVEMIGKTFGRLTVVNELPTRAKCGQKLYRCRCTCGGWSPAVRGRSLRTGETKSCGCINREMAAKMGKSGVVHGLSDKSGNSHYRRWSSIKMRTGNPNHMAYKNYGGRGIKLHEPWEKDFISFKTWLDDNLGPCPDGHSLDRIDNDGDYEPSNLRWASRKTQNSNRRSI